MEQHKRIKEEHQELNQEKPESKQVKLEVLTKEILIVRMHEFMAIEKYWVDEPWTEASFFYELPNKWDLSSIATVEDALAGYNIVSQRSPGQAYLHKVLVDPHYRGMGVGTALHGNLRKNCAAMDITELTMKSLIDNYAAHRVYEKYGCEIVGREVSADGKERFLHREVIEV